MGLVSIYFEHVGLFWKYFSADDQYLMELELFEKPFEKMLISFATDDDVELQVLLWLVRMALDKKVGGISAVERE